MSAKCLVTCALPYVNNVPHLGNVVPIVSADVFTRFLRLKGERAIYICATDEHGTRTEMEAKRAGLIPEAWCQQMHSQIAGALRWFDVRFDHFGRTSARANHEITQDIFRHLDQNGYVFEQETRQLFCDHCGHFLPDTFVSGTCPICATHEVSGDQCDGCGHFLDPLALIEPTCKVCGGRPASRTSRHLFLDLPKLAPRIQAWVEQRSHWKGIARSIPLSWIKEGLQPRCITRDLTWGVKVPKPGFEDKVFYVWFDAPIGYIAATADWASQAQEDWRDWWKDPATRVVHFLGKDNVPFHTLMWPGSLIGADDGWALPYDIAANEYLNYEGSPFSKSRGWGIFATDVSSLPFAPDVWRYSLMANRPEKKDVDFSWEALLHHANSDLVGNLGNFAHRTISLVARHFGAVPPESTDPADREAISRAGQLAEQVASLYAAVRLRDATAALLELGDHGNLYFQRSAPWEWIKKDRARCGEILHTAVRILSHLTWAMAPLLPRAAADIRRQLGVKTESDAWELDPSVAGLAVGVPRPVFARADPEQILAFQARFRGRKEEAPPRPLSYGIDPEIDYFSLVAELSGLDIKKRSSQLERLKRATLADLDLDAIRNSPRVSAYRPLLASRDLGGRTTSVDNLCAIVERAGQLPVINTLVDAYNLQSLKHGVVMGAYDRRALRGNLRMKVANGHEHFVPVTGREPEKITPGEWVIVDEEDRVVTKILTKQSEAVAVTVATTHAALCVQGNPSIDHATLHGIAVETCELIQELCGGSWRIVNG